ncbi:hypothetical protein BDR06DRAFT_975633 [Suillus hirtellus]|nr:hypothetical protein BDR06DRAFT_975633 [Suillus hirtellus]
MSSSPHFQLQNFDEWWHQSTPTISGLADIPHYHIGQFKLDTKTFELHKGPEVLALIPAHYRNGLRFLNHIIICLQQLLRHSEPLFPVHKKNLLLLKYEAIGRELMLLSKIREAFIQEVNSQNLVQGIGAPSWMSPILNSFLAYMFYCKSLDPGHKSSMMSVEVDDPQTYNWYHWAKEQQIPGLWGTLPKDPAELQAAMLQSAIAGISLEPCVESPGPCSDTWCAGMIHKMMVELDHNQPPQEIKVVNDFQTETCGASIDASDNIVKRGRGRPKGVTNSIITVPQLQIRSPIKLRSNNRSSHSSGPSGTGQSVFFAKNLEESQISMTQLHTPLKHKSILEVGDLDDVVNKAQELPLLIQKTLKLTEEYPEKNHTTSLVETDVPALDLSLTSMEQHQTSTEKGSAVHSVLSTNDFLEYIETPSSSATSEHPDKSNRPQIFLPSSSYPCQKRLQDNFSLEDQTTMANPPSRTSQPQDTSLSVTSGSSVSDELDMPSQITCKILKGTLIFSCAKNQVDLGFDFESVTLVPGILKSKSKKGTGKSLQSPKKKKIILQTQEQSKGTKEISESSPIPQPKSKAMEIPAHKGKEKAKTKEDIPKPSPKLQHKSQAAETISANLSKVAGACQNSSNQGELEWNDKVSKIMASKDIEYVYWMKNKDRMSVLDEDAKSGFKVLFDLLKMK